MFLDIDKKPAGSVAAIDETGAQITYAGLANFSLHWYTHINRRALIFILSENSIGSMAGYVAALDNRVVPLIVGSATDRQLLDNLIHIYQPAYLWVPEKLTENFAYRNVYNAYGYSLLETRLTCFPLYEHLSLLLPTSGSTGSPKLVRHSYRNVAENAKNVAAFFELAAQDRAIAILPIQYTMGLSVVSSHLYAGATLLLVNGSLTDGHFWKFIREQKATSFTGVPYSFEILQKLRFLRMDLPHLKLITQGGGKLSPELFRALADYAATTGRKFIATYGQTEGTARMAYLPAELAIEKTCSIGKAIPNGELILLDQEGNEIKEAGIEGEMIYKGPNVTLGYALCGQDLSKGDEFNGLLRTGDIAKKDAAGFYFIAGRVSRFLKLYGLRIGLDEVERIVKGNFDTDCVCTGNDAKMNVLITNADLTAAVAKFITEKTGLFHMAFDVTVVDEIKRNEAGKVLYQ